MITAPVVVIPPTSATGPDDELVADIGRRMRQFDQVRRCNIGFPGATDFDYTSLAGLLATHLLKNVGDPHAGGAGLNHTKDLEREVVGFCADLFRAPVDDPWGYATSGGSEGNLYALHLTWTLYPDATLDFGPHDNPYPWGWVSRDQLDSDPDHGEVLRWLGALSELCWQTDAARLDARHRSRP